MTAVLVRSKPYPGTILSEDVGCIKLGDRVVGDFIEIAPNLFFASRDETPDIVAEYHGEEELVAAFSERG